MSPVTYTSDLDPVDWAALKALLHQDAFDNGRSPEQLRKSFENSYVCGLAYAEPRLIGTARALSDGICNAYVVDVWTFTPYRRQGIARTMVQRTLAQLQGSTFICSRTKPRRFIDHSALLNSPSAWAKWWGSGWILDRSCVEERRLPEIVHRIVTDPGFQGCGRTQAKQWTTAG